MTIDRCPGMDNKAWTGGSVFEEPCPHCGETIEFWRDDTQRKCDSCGKMAPNPHAAAEAPAKE